MASDPTATRESDQTGSGSRRPLLRGRGGMLGRIAIVAIILLAGPLAPPGMRTVLIVTLVYGLFAMAYDVLLGFSDQPSLGQGLFFGLGSYGVVLPILDHQASLPVALIVAAVIGGVVALLVGSVAVRLSEAFHVIITALFASIAYLLANNLSTVTGGSGGRTVTVPSMQLGGVELSVYSPLGSYLLVAVIVAAAYLLLDRLVASPVGQVWVAIRENPQRAANLGINVYRYRLLAFVVSGAITAVAGGLYAVVLRFTSAEFFGFTWSVLPFVWVLVGGMGTLVGALVGAAVFAAFQFYVAQLWTHYLIVLGVALLVLLRWSPKGLVGTVRDRWPTTARDGEDAA